MKFVLGRACSGKSKYIVDKAAEASLTKQSIIIVPEQFSFETERSVLHTAAFNPDNIKVLSFTKLYNQVSKECGFGNLPTMTDGERILLTDMALKQSAEQLNVLRKFASYPDFALKVADTIRDFKFAAVSGEKLYNIAEEIGGGTGEKLKDISTIMSVYDALISDKFIDPSDYLTRLYYLLSDFEFFKNKAVFFDSFTGFTGQQNNIIKRIFAQTDDVTLSFCTDDISSTDYNIFYNINRTAVSILDSAREYNVELTETVCLDCNYYNNEALKRLEASFFKKREELDDFTSNDAVKIISCSDPREEAFAATNIVRNLVDLSGYRYRDFIIVARNADTYKNHIELFCKKNNIQCFYDKKVRLIDTALYIYIDLLLQLSESFSTNNILNFLKTGFNGYSKEDIYSLEEYAYVWNMSGASWDKDWEMNPAGMTERPMNDKQIKLLENINNIRRSVYEKLNGFLSSFKGDAKNRSKAIYNFLVSENIGENLSFLCSFEEERGNRFEASVLRQSWDTVMGVLNSLARLYNGNITSKDYHRAFSISCKAIEIANIPQMLDEVTFGSADRIRPSKPKIAIILGANQGVFPDNKVKNGLLSAKDKCKLEDKNILLNDNAVKSSVEENYLVYSMVCCAIDRSYIMYSDKSLSGEALDPSAFITTLINRNNGLDVKKYEPLNNDEFLPATPESSLYLMTGLYGKDYETVKTSLKNNEEVEGKVKSFEKKGFFDKYQITPENSKALFGNNIYISASKFDDFHSCRLMYFLKHGLGSGKIRKAEINVMQRGTMTHYVLEKMVDRHKKALCELTEAEINIEVDQLLSEYIENIVGGKNLLTPRFKFILSRIARSTKDVVKHLAKEFAQSGFEPKYCELHISSNGDIPELRLPIDDGEMILTGKIDRVDTFKNTVRIVDYKTGSKEFALSDTLVGLNMQMLIYLYALLKNGGKLLGEASAGGILYMPAQTTNTKKNLTMNGLILNDDEIMTAMDSERDGTYIPKYKAEGSSFADAETFDLIFENIERLIVLMGGKIRKGDFCAEPQDGVKSKACTYCDFASVCRMSDSKHRRAEKHSNEEIKQILKGGNDNAI